MPDSPVDSNQATVEPPALAWQLGDSWQMLDGRGATVDQA